jgi:hypothetical protein
MKPSFVALVLMGSALAKPMPQAVTSAIAPESPVPSGCSESTSGNFRLTVVNVTSSSEKRAIEKRQQSGILTLTLADGVLKDQAGRTGYVASNFQFQFDSPPQAGAIYTSGFSLCSNNSLALGGSAIFYQCWSGGFFNLYDRGWADHCVPIYMVSLNDGNSPGQTPISEATNGEPQVPTQAPVTQISDGQPQAPTNPVAPGPVISQISDGQPQVPTKPAGPVISQISDGQPQVPTTPAPAPPGPVISQISDGQPQVPTSAPSVTPALPVSQISDGQPQVPAATGNYTVATATAPAQFTGAAATPVYGLGALAAGMMGLAAIL